MKRPEHFLRLFLSHTLSKSKETLFPREGKIGIKIPVKQIITAVLSTL